MEPAVRTRSGRPQVGGAPAQQEAEITGRITRAALLAAFVVVAYGGFTAAQVWAAARSEQAAPAQAIVVLGAAQYDGDPSPALRGRLTHAAALYQRGIAPILVVTGGRQPGDRFTEATASARYLHEQGVPESALRREVSGRSTYESLAATARFLRPEGIAEVVLVSDPYHSLRLRHIADEVGLKPAVSPARADVEALTAGRRILRETFAVALGRIIGYRRLAVLEQRLGGWSSASGAAADPTAAPARFTAHAPLR